MSQSPLFARSFLPLGLARGSDLDPVTPPSSNPTCRSQNFANLAGLNRRQTTEPQRKFYTEDPDVSQRGLLVFSSNSTGIFKVVRQSPLLRRVVPGIGSSTCTNLLDTSYFLRQYVGCLFLSFPVHGSPGINVGGPRVLTQVTAVIHLVDIQLTRTMMNLAGLSGCWSPSAVLCVFSTRRKTWLSQIKQKEPNVQGVFCSPSQPRVHQVRHLPGTQ